jgi:hypothetical protein
MLWIRKQRALALALHTTQGGGKDDEEVEGACGGSRRERG